MKKIITSGLRVALVLIGLALFGIYSGIHLPISLFPNTSKPTINVQVNYAGMSAQDFITQFGGDFEGELKRIESGEIEVEKVTSNYSSRSVEYSVEFGWGVEIPQALKEVQAISNNLKSRLPIEAADSVDVWNWNRNTGFLSISFFSEKRGMDELFEILDPIFTPELSKIEDADNPVLWNPKSKEILVSLLPYKMAQHGILPRNIISAIERSRSSYMGANLPIGEKGLSFKINGNLKDIDEIKNIQIGNIFLSEVAKVQLAEKTNARRTFKTNGAPSLILWSKPKGDGNVKKMSEDIIALVKSKQHLFPKDIKYKILVDPSEFIRSSINNVVKEVLLAAFLAVLILFLFVGNFKNVITAAIEIPMSMVVAFILMKFTDMNLNLISLGGLALASGMNVDASVVVLENIFRHQLIWKKSNEGNPTVTQCLEIVTKGVKEVALPIIISMITTLVVFIPLAFTSDLTSAILGDLAKAVIFSHGFSAFVAIVLVPTIRFQLMKKNGIELKPAPMDRALNPLSQKYREFLEHILKDRKRMAAILITPLIILILMGAFILPKLPKEIIGKPDSDWMVINAYSQASRSKRQMENYADEVENKALEKFGKYFSYTFSMVDSKRNATVMLRLKDKKDMDSVWKLLEAEYENSPGVYFWVGPWNPAELPLPDPPHLKLVLKNKNYQQAKRDAQKLKVFIRDTKIYRRTRTSPSVEFRPTLVMNGYPTVWQNIRRNSIPITQMDIVDLSRFAINGRTLRSVEIGKKSFPITVKFDDKTFHDVETLKSFPIGIKGEVHSLQALGSLEEKRVNDRILRVDGHRIVELFSRLERKNESEYLAKLAEFKDKFKTSTGLISQDTNLEFSDAQKVLTDSMDQLKISMALSLLLIFLVLMMQFQSFLNTAVVLFAIPLGLIGVLSSLYIFGSNISLNSVLGIILLNGIAVNNSILLVEFSNKIFNEGSTALFAVVEAANKRLRPILITSLTTILGMAPLALGMGEGGKILQPLGIAVSGGLAISTVLTLITVPILQYMVLSRSKNRSTQMLDIEDQASHLNSHLSGSVINEKQREESGETWLQ